MNKEKAIAHLFNYYYDKFYGLQYDLSLKKENHIIVIDKFFNTLYKQYGEAAIGMNFLIDYFSFTWSYWSDKKTKRRITLSWIIGKKAIERWFNREKHYQYHYQVKLLNPYGFDMNHLIWEVFPDDTDSGGLNPTEENDKKRFNGEGQLASCLQFTTLYNHRSTICILCPCKVLCKIFLKETNQSLYKKRGYEAIK